MKKIMSYLILCVPFGLLWVILTNQVSLESYLIGFLMGIIVVLLGVHSDAVTLNITKLPQRIINFILYSIFMLWQVTVSGWDVALRTLKIRPIKPGIIALEIGDETNNEYIAGASAHSITITPGELVVEYDRDCRVMYVHCIDVEQSQKHSKLPKLIGCHFLRGLLAHESIFIHPIEPCAHLLDFIARPLCVARG